MNRILPTSVFAMVALAACSSLPAPNARLDEARTAVRIAQNNPQARDLAGGEMKQATDALSKAEEAWTRREDTAEIDHLSYLAKQRAAIAQEAGSQKGAEQAVTDATAARDKIRLAARTSEAEKAQRSAASAERQSEASQRQSEASQRQSEAAMLQAQASQRQAEGAKQSADASMREAADAQQKANSAEARNLALEQQLRDMNAKQTDRGPVITIGDVLFDTDRSQLKAGSARHVEKLGGFLKQYPQRRALVEGFTDSTGSDGHNQELSGRRADAVRAALVDMGVGRDRIDTRGYGESYPVAGNESAAGRQLNRRVEIILSDAEGKIAPR